MQNYRNLLLAIAAAVLIALAAFLMLGNDKQSTPPPGPADTSTK